MNTNTHTPDPNPATKQKTEAALDGATCSASWLPIETAPKDGTMIDLCCESVEEDQTYRIRLTDVAWHEASEIFPHTGWIRVLDDGNFDLVDGPPSCPMGLPQWTPTHWMPLPSLPNAKRIRATDCTPPQEPQ